MLRGAVLFLGGFLAGVYAMGCGVAVSMKSDPKWWRLQLVKLTAAAPPAAVEGTDYDPTRYRAGGAATQEAQRDW